MRVRPAAFAGATALAVVLAACGGGDASDPGTEAGTAAEDAGGDADVALATTDLGEVLVDAEGMTLYLFTVDPEGASACEDDCAAAWPPLVVDDGPIAGDGVDAALIGTIERSDGSTQVTYAGSPLYTWASDGEPGDVTGQGVNDVWYVVAADGEAVTEAAPEDADQADADQADEADADQADVDEAATDAELGY